MQTLSHLAPDTKWKPDLAKTINRMRPTGSQKLSILTPSRLPEDSRSYIPGDPIDKIDWQAFARSDQLLIRQVREQAPGRVSVHLACDKSIYWPDVDSKWELSCRIAFNIVFNHLAAGDTIEVYLRNGFGEVESVWIPRGRSEAKALYDRLKKNNFEEGTQRKFPHGQHASGNYKPSLSYLIADSNHCQGFEKQISEPYMRFIHVCSEQELDISWTESNALYFDGRDKNAQYTKRSLSQNYEKKLNEFFSARERIWSKGRKTYLRCSIKTPVNRYLRHLELGMSK